LVHFGLFDSNRDHDYVTFRQHNQEADENSLISNHGKTQNFTEFINEWIRFLIKIIRQDLQDMQDFS
jgi:hypothetical protein